MASGLAAEFRSLRDAAVLLSMALVLGLLALTEPMTSFDGRLLAEVQSVRADWLTAVFRAASASASSLVAVAAVGGGAAILLLRGRGSAAGWVLAVILGGWGIAVVLRQLLNRPPPQAHLLVQVGSGSYPSTQVAFAMGCALSAYALARHTRYRPLVVAVSTAGVCLVGLSTLYLGVHYPTDVVGGVLVSTAVAALVYSFRPNPAGAEPLPSWPQL